jgi:CubicO group peptidase (beta-lactamase class C family)
MSVAAWLGLTLAPVAAVEGRGAEKQQLPRTTNPLPLARVQALVDRYVSTGRTPGIVVAVGTGDAPATFLQAGSLSDDPGAAKAGPDTLWRIYSMTKPITAMAAMKLVEDGRLGLDQPIGELIPAFASMRVLTSPDTSLDSRPASRPITVRNLLTHTGGLVYQFLGKGPLREEYKRLGLLGGRADEAASKAQPATLAEFADRAASLPLVAEPGAEWNYSVGMDVLGRVIEVASGMPFERYVQTRLLDPLGMNSTFWTVPPRDAGRLAAAYAWTGTDRVAVDRPMSSEWLQAPRVHYGGSGLVSSARDYDRFLQMLAGYGKVGRVRVLKRETVRLAMSNLLPPGVSVVGTGTPDTAVAEGFGAGGWVYTRDVPGGVRAGTYGWFGAAGTVAFIDPAKRLRVTVMVNYFPANKWPLHADVLAALYPQ